MFFDELNKKQPDVMKMLVNSYSKNRLSHAYLFEGENGTGKIDVAKAFAMMVLCENDKSPCGVCSNCKRIEKNTHPNVYMIEPDGNTIKKEQINNLQKEFSKTSLEAGPKVYIINNVDRMTASASNSLLKFLEEPFSESYAILITDNIQKILSTIISRSQVLNFRTLNNYHFAEQLINAGNDENIARVVSVLTNDFNDAEDLCNNDDIYNLYDLVVELYNIHSYRNESMLLYFNKNGNDVFNNADMKSYFIQLLIMYQQDILNYKINQMDKILYNSNLNTIKKISEWKNIESIIEELQFLLMIKERLMYPINDRLAFDQIFLKFDRGEFNERNKSYTYTV